MPSPDEPLRGRTVVVTRSADDAVEISRRIAALGAHVIAVPCIRSLPLPPDERSRRALEELGETAWLVFSSRHGVDAFAALLAHEQKALPSEVRLAAVGPATAAAVTSVFARAPDFVSISGHAAGMGEELARVALPSDGIMLLPAARAGRPELAEALRRGGFRVTQLHVYETRPAEASDGPVDLPNLVHDVLFTSPSTVRGFLARVSVPAGAHVITIGPSTTAAAEQAGLQVYREARPHTLDGLIAALL